MSEISQSITHKHCSCFEIWITDFSAHFQFWKDITVPANTDKVWGAVQCLCSKDDNVSAALQNSDGCGEICVFAHAFIAFLGYFWFWMGDIEVARWNRVDFLVPKQLRKSKIGLLEQIWAKNPYVTFFLGHPVDIIDIITNTDANLFQNPSNSTDPC